MHCPTIDQLPLPPRLREGWPWTEGSSRIPDQLPNGSPWPRVSIVTPSFNQVEYIEETIRSVLLQGYPNLEYIIIDGGSTDGSVEIIKKYEPWLAYWVSEPDRGQSHAINKGFAHSTGEIMAYLNSDDIYYPNAIIIVVRELQASSADILIGGEDQVEIADGNARFITRSVPGDGPSVHLSPIFRNGRVEDFRLTQTSMFWRRSLWEITGQLNEDHHFNMDREWLLRALARGAEVQTIDNILSRFSWHKGSKSQDLQQYFYLESAQMYLRFSNLPEFNRIPCLLDYANFRLRSLQSIYTMRSKQLKKDGKLLEAMGARLFARLFRRLRLVANFISNNMRVHSKKRLYTQ